MWLMTTMDAIGTGIQFFRFGDTDLEVSQLRQVKIELMLAGTANATLADARGALDVKIKLPPPDRSNCNVRRLQIWALSTLPANHPLHAYIEGHYNNMESFCPVWSTWKPAMYPILAQAKGVFHLKYMSTELSEYWKDQSKLYTVVALPSVTAILFMATAFTQLPLKSLRNGEGPVKYPKIMIPNLRKFRTERLIFLVRVSLSKTQVSNRLTFHITEFWRTERLVFLVRVSITHD